MPPDRDPNLQDELRDLGSHVEYPPTPDLAGFVKSRLDAGNDASAPPTRSGPSLWWVAAAALVVLTALPVLSPGIRDMAVGVFSAGGGGMAGGAGSGGQGGGAASSGDEAAGGGSVTEEPTMSSAQGAQAGSAAAGAASASSGAAATARASNGGPDASERRAAYRASLGERITPREARARSEAPILLPRASRLGKPDGAYDNAHGLGFVFLYRARQGLPDLRNGADIGLLLAQTPGDVGRTYLAGGTSREAGPETASVDGGQGYWIPPGEDRLKVARSLGPASGVLLWEREGQALRLEADVTKEKAVRIAESVR